MGEREGVGEAWPSRKKSMGVASAMTRTWRSGRPRRTSAMRYADSQGTGALLAESSAVDPQTHGQGFKWSLNDLTQISRNHRKHFKQGGQKKPVI